MWGACRLDRIPSPTMDTLTQTEGAAGDSCSVRRRCMHQEEYLSGISFSDPVLHPMSYKIFFLCWDHHRTIVFRLEGTSGSLLLKAGLAVGVSPVAHGFILKPSQDGYCRGNRLRSATRRIQLHFPAGSLGYSWGSYRHVSL